MLVFSHTGLYDIERIIKGTVMKLSTTLARIACQWFKVTFVYILVLFFFVQV